MTHDVFNDFNETGGVYHKSKVCSYCKSCSRILTRRRLVPCFLFCNISFWLQKKTTKVMSILWPAEDMPWTESGLTPDILFNPHGTLAFLFLRVFIVL